MTMDETAAQVQTMTLWPSLKPRVCNMNPREEKMMLMHTPAGAASQDRRLASRKPVRQQAAESPKQAPACVRASSCKTGSLATTPKRSLDRSQPRKGPALIIFT